MQKHATTLVALLAVLVFYSAEAQAQVRAPGKLGIGIGHGTYATGLSVKYFMGGPLAFQGNLGVWRGWGYNYCSGRRRFDYDWCRRNDVLGLGADLLYEQPDLVSTGALSLAWNVGGGLGLGIWDNGISLAANFILGLEFNIDALPIDITLEYRPGLHVIPGFGFDLVHFGGHIRYFF